MDMAREKFNYFSKLHHMTLIAKRAAEVLVDVAANFDPDKLESVLVEMHNIEHEGDVSRHELVEHLMHEFIPPIELEDIAHLVEALDDCVDTLEDVLINMHIYNINGIEQDAEEFVGIIVGCVDAMSDMMAIFDQFKKPANIHAKIIEVNNFEDKGDVLFFKAMRRLYAGQYDVRHIIAWDKIYNSLELCCDTCEDVADLVESILMKNS